MVQVRGDCVSASLSSILSAFIQLLTPSRRHPFKERLLYGLHLYCKYQSLRFKEPAGDGILSKARRDESRRA
jgi:hypothetical protein